jgi:3-oxoadipate CoA-transferase beta subunit
VTATVTTEYPDRAPLSRAEMAELVADDLALGSFVNLGIGLPTTVADYLDPAAGIILHTENGMLGMGPAADGESIDVDLINAGKTPVTEMAGAAYFHHADSFAMMRGGHLDVCVLGAFQVSQHGDLANWHTGAPDAVPAVGGAMDLAIGAKAVFVMMELFTKAGAAKLVPRCTYPMTALGCVTRLYTDRAVFAIGAQGVDVLATYGTSLTELQQRLDLPLGRPRQSGAPCSGPRHRIKAPSGRQH